LFLSVCNDIGDSIRGNKSDAGSSNSRGGDTMNFADLINLGIGAAVVVMLFAAGAALLLGVGHVDEKDE
jgi:hypothetical protein